MESSVYLEKIAIAPPTAKIYQRTGFKKKTTQLSASKQKETDGYIEEAVSLILLQGSFLRLSIDNNDGKSITFSGGLKFASAKLSAFLRDCMEAALLGRLCRLRFEKSKSNLSKTPNGKNRRNHY